MVWHALASYRHDGAMRTALVLEATLHDLEQTADALSVTAEWTRASVAELLERWARVRPGIDALAGPPPRRAGGSRR